jgi:mono/diheme cytochrome c family protein
MRLRTPIAAAIALIAAPLALAQDAPAPDGKALYDKKCTMCHGANGVAKSMAKGAANLNDPAWQAKVTDADIESTFTKGKGKMKAIKMTAQEGHAIVAYVLKLK